MIEGVVNAGLEAVIDLTVEGPGGQRRSIEAIVDTGFGGFLTLPPGHIAELRLQFEGMGRATLGDGSEIRFPFYEVAVRWDGSTRFGLAEATDTTPLIGMTLLERHRHSWRVHAEVTRSLQGSGKRADILIEEASLWPVVIEAE